MKLSEGLLDRTTAAREWFVGIRFVLGPPLKKSNVLALVATCHNSAPKKLQPLSTVSSGSPFHERNYLFFSLLQARKLKLLFGLREVASPQLDSIALVFKQSDFQPLQMASQSSIFQVSRPNLIVGIVEVLLESVWIIVWNMA